jgi:hypothetical protein
MIDSLNTALPQVGGVSAVWGSEIPASLAGAYVERTTIRVPTTATARYTGAPMSSSNPLSSSKCLVGRRYSESLRNARLS